MCCELAETGLAVDEPQVMRMEDNTTTGDIQHDGRVHEGGRDVNRVENHDVSCVAGAGDGREDRGGIQNLYRNDFERFP